MRVLFIADHHIKLGQKNVPKKWSRSRFKGAWNKVAKLATDNNIATIFHGGDIFDAVPSTEELQIYGEMLNILKDFTNIIYPGNHEAINKRHSFLEHLAPLSKAYVVNNYMPEAEVLSSFGIPNSAILPYTDLKTKVWHKDKGEILFSHVRGAIPPHVESEIDLKLLANWETVYAGDLHSHKLCQENIIYPGSPMATTFRRSLGSGDNGILIIDTEINSWEFVDLELPQLLKRTVYAEKDVIKTTPHHTAYELVGAETSMSKVADKDLVAKKMSNVEVEQEGIILRATNIEDELVEYLTKKEGIEEPNKYVSLMRDIV